MKYLVCGDREWKSWKVIRETLSGLGPNTIIVHGDARGADKMAGWLAEHEFNYDFKPYPADWNAHGEAAGPIRNRLMLDTEHPDLVIAFHDDLSKSKGTKDMCEYANSQGVPVDMAASDGSVRRWTRATR